MNWFTSLSLWGQLQVDFDGEYPIEGAKEVGTLMTRHVTRALKVWTRAAAAKEAERAAAHKAAGKKKRLKPLGPQRLMLQVTPDGLGLQIVS